MKRTDKITAHDENAARLCREHWNSIGKPLHSLGLLEDSIIKISGITGTPNVKLDKRCAVIFCADNGVVCEGISQSESIVTTKVAHDIAEGTSNINAMADKFGADVFAVDVGIKDKVLSSKLIDRKISHGTDNIANGPAMSYEQASKAIETGIDIAGELKGKGYDIIVTGEMGIGNTTTSAAIAAVLLDTSPEYVTGRGAGLDNKGLMRKISVIKKAIEVNRPDKNDAFDILRKLGGYDIAAMTGLFLGGGIYHIPIIIDGFISAAAAALTIKIAPLCGEYMLCSHVSKEPAGKMLLDSIGQTPLITAQLCLGEGTGGILLLPLLDAALAVYNNAHSFDELEMERYSEY